MSIDYLEDVKQNPIYNRNMYRKLTIISFILIGVLFAQMAYIYHQHFIQPEQTYFITTTSGEVTQIFPKE